MTKTLVAALIALGLTTATIAPTLAHRPSNPPTTVEKPFPSNDFWEELGRARV